MKRTILKGLQQFIQIFISLLILYWLWTRMDREALMEALHTARLGRLLIPFSVHFLALGVSLIRWQLLLRPLGIHLSLFAVGWVYMMGGFFNSFLPSSIGGDAVRILKTGEWTGLRAEAAASVVIERWSGMIAFLMFCLMALGMGAYVYLGVYGTALIVALTLSMSISLVWMFKRKVPSSKRPILTLRRKWENFRDAIHSYGNHLTAFAWAMAWAFVVQAVLIGYYVILAWSLNMPGTLLGFAVVVPISELISMLPISLGGFGTREAVFIGMADLLGLSPEQGFFLSFVRGVLGLLFNLLGVVTLWYPYAPSPPARIESSELHR